MSVLDRCGIILAGGLGSRLWPSTHGTSKQLLMIYDKPMIYYPLTTLMLGGIRDILIITAPEQIEQFKAALGDGTRFGIKLSYEVQEKPDGIASAFKIGKEFIGNRSVALILGDNIFYADSIGSHLDAMIADASLEEHASVFLKWVPDPERFGVAVLSKDEEVSHIIEKPHDPQSNFAVVGLYVYPSTVIDYVMTLNPSARGEYEITDLNNMYAITGKLESRKIERSGLWFDTGTVNSMNDAAAFIRIAQENSGQMIGCPEEVAITNRWYTNVELDDVTRYACSLKNDYGKYLRKLLGVEK